MFRLFSRLEGRFLKRILPTPVREKASAKRPLIFLGGKGRGWKGNRGKQSTKYNFSLLNKGNFLISDNYTLRIIVIQIISLHHSLLKLQFFLDELESFHSQILIVLIQLQTDHHFF